MPITDNRTKVTHSIIVIDSQVMTAKVWYPDLPDTIYYHWINDDGTIRSEHYHMQTVGRPMSATEFIENFGPDET